MKAKKHLGQHFLIDNQVIHRIVSLIAKHCEKDTPMLEVGAGQGVLTEHLHLEYPNFKTVELDEDMVNILMSFLQPSEIIHKDFLRLDLNSIFDSSSFNLVGNFPYNISSQIIFKMIENVDMIPKMIGMFQKEVAERICAGPGGKTNGIISIRAQVFYHAEKIFDIPPEAFSPPPKVNSSVIVLTRKKDYDLPCNEKLFSRIIKTAFQQRRKKLRNTLKSIVLDTDDPIFHKRPEELTVEEFVNITLIVQKQENHEP